MDFRELLMCAEENQKSKESKPQKGKFLKTQLPPPKRDLKNEMRSEPKSEVLKKLLEEKEEEKRRKKMEEEKERRKREEEKRYREEELRRLEKERLREEKKRNTFRIPKKVVPEDDQKETSLSPSHHREVLSDGSFSLDSDLISDADLSDFDGQLKDKPKSSSSSRHKHKSPEVGHRDSKKHPGSHKSSDKASMNESSNRHTSSSSSNRYSSTGENQKMSISERHGDRGRTYNKSSHHSSQSHRESRSEKGGSENHKNDKSYSDKHQDASIGHSHKSSHSSSDNHRSSRKEPSRDSNKHSSDSSLNKSGSSSSKENHSESSAGASKQGIKPESTTEDCGFSTLSRHHLKPTIVRQGGSLEEREKVLAKLQAILAKQNASDDVLKGMRKRVSKEEAKARKSRRNKGDLEGVVSDFSGSCMEPVPYSPDEKPSLKRPEPKPEPDPKPVKQSKPTKQAKAPREKVQKFRSAPSSHSNFASDLKHSSKGDSSSQLRDRPKPKPKPRPPPPPMNFSELLKIAEQKQAEPVMVELAPKKKESRPMTQEEIDRVRARQERIKSEEYKDWFKHGEQGVKGKKPQHMNGHVEKAASTNSQQPQNKSGQPASRMLGGSGSSARSSNSKLSGSYESSSAGRQPGHGDSHLPSKHFSQELQKPTRPVVRPGQPDPNRPGVIAGKPRAMMQHISEQSSAKGKLSLRTCEKRGKRPPSAEREPAVESVPASRFQSLEGKGKAANAWDSLFSRPEYKSNPPARKRKMVIDSEDEDECEDEMEDFIDDGGEEDMDTVSGAIRQLFGYDKRKYRYVDDDDDNMEASFSQVMKEEARSAKLGLMEDLEDIRREEEERRQKIAKKKILARR